jgi:peptidoglycan hydrolase CwlO-like protein
MNNKLIAAAFLAFIMQSAGAIWWASSINSKLEAVVVQVGENETDIKDGGSIEPRLVRVETDISYIRKAVDNNQDRLRMLDDKITELLREAKAPSR